MRNKLTSDSSSNFDVEKLRSMMIEITKWAGQEAETALTQGEINFLGIPISEKLDIYQNAIEQIDVYMKERGLHFIKPDKPSHYDRDIWYEKITRSYHTVMLFARQLGFDPLTFTPLKDSIFKARAYKKSSGKLSWTSDYRRHHLNKYGKQSSLLQDLALTDLWAHNYWNLISEADARVLITQFSALVNKEGIVTRQDIEAAFKGYEWVLNDKRTGWFNNDKFDKYLKEFNDRKDKYQSLGLDGFMQEYEQVYQNLYNRFYQTVVDDKGRSLILFTRPMRPYGVADYSDVVGWEFYFSNNP